MEFRAFRVYVHDNTFVEIVLANINMNIKIYWPKTKTLEQKNEYILLYN